ncbi:RNA polymerase sigma factor [Micromonospora sp. 050-3]|uniref:RNA polymerase sigma factor n=1 Tax=Micromonospora sp. 050-3 TaxID=2789265 RepID=UPI00397AA262
MLVKRSSMLPGNGTEVDWKRLSAEVSDLADLASAVAAFGAKVPPDAATVRRWQELPTAALVALAQAGHRDAFDPLYRRYSRAVRVYAENRLRIVGRTADADDVASLTWMKAMGAIGRYQPRVDGDPFKAWLLTIARYECARMMDRLRVETPVSDDTETALWDHRPAVGHAVADSGEMPETAEKLRMLACLRDGVSDLPVEQQTVLRLRLEGAALCDVARLTGWDYRRVTRVWEAAQHALRARLTGGDDDLFADRDAVRAAAATLPAAQREVVLMRLDGMRECDIVRATGRSKKAVSGAWERAKRAMRDEMAGFTTAARQEMTPGDLVALRAAAATLPAAQREVALMRLDGMRSCDIVRATGRSTSAVANAWDRARKTFTRHGLTAVA